MRRFDGQVAIITGGASGIGRALGVELAKRGAEVVLADRQVDLAREVAAEIEHDAGRASGVALDVRDYEAFAALAKDVVARHGSLDLLFNNAGIAVGGEMDTYGAKDWEDVIDVNLTGVAAGIQAAYPIMIAQGRGHIVNTASVAGLFPVPNEGSYTATKHAVVALSRALRVEAKRHGVRVSALCPGVVRTPILHGGQYGRMNMPDPSAEKMDELWKLARPMDPRRFAREVLDAVHANEAIIVVPRYWKALWYLDRVSPSLSHAFWDRVLAKQRGLFGG